MEYIDQFARASLARMLDDHLHVFTGDPVAAYAELCLRDVAIGYWAPRLTEEEVAYLKRTIIYSWEDSARFDTSFTSLRRREVNFQVMSGAIYSIMAGFKVTEDHRQSLASAGGHRLYEQAEMEAHNLWRKCLLTMSDVDWAASNHLNTVRTVVGQGLYMCGNILLVKGVDPLRKLGDERYLYNTASVVGLAYHILGVDLLQ